MKVLVCIPCLLTGGTEVQTLSLVEALRASGHEVIVVVYFEYSESMVQRYLSTGATVELLSPDGVRTIGVKATAKHLWRGLKQIINNERPDVTHVQYMAPGALSIFILRALGMKKILATTHTSADIYGKNGKLIIRFLTNHLLKAFQCITEKAERSYFGSSSLFNGKISKHFTIHNNIPSHIDILMKPRFLKKLESHIIVGVVSRLEPIKGMDLVVPSFALAAKENHRLRLLVVGDGSQRQLMEQQAHEAEVSSKIKFIGSQPQSALQYYYDQIDILLMPSRSEGFGLTAIEGMARGCVLIVANVGGLPEVVTPDCGFHHKPEDTTDIAIKIIQATKQLNHYSNNALMRARDFSVNRYITNIRKLYSQL